MFRFFIIWFPFLVLGLVAFLPDEPGDAGRFPFLPKLCAALQRKFGTDAAYCADGRYVFGLVSRDESHRQWHCLWFCSGDATPLAELGSGRSLRRSSASQLDER